MEIIHEHQALANEQLDNVYQDLKSTIFQAVQQSQPVHKVEKAVWEQLLRLGRQALGQFFTLQGNGDMGETVTLPDGQCCQRLEQEHKRRYVSIFGEFELSRVVYGSREGQKIEFVPLDNRLQLPQSAFSYLLQNWDQSLCVEQAFGQARTSVQRILGLNQSVDSLEQMNQDMAKQATNFMLNQPPPPEEGEIIVASADQKGIVMRRSAKERPNKSHRCKGDKASRKRMATVTTVYSVNRYERTPEEVVAALFRDAPEPSGKRPQPQAKEVWATLPQDDVPGSGIDRGFAWIIGELFLRGRGKNKRKPLIFLADGQEALWAACLDWLPERVIGILDLLHVTPRLWKVAHLFHKEGSQAAEQFVRERLLRVLQGKAAGVIRGLREMGTKRGLNGAKKKALNTVCNYLEANLERMRYDEYLKAGYPIASGVIEGACRHLVKDRMERAGMHWTMTGAQAMLDVRSIHVSGLWEEYQSYRIAKETQKLYPHRSLVEQNFALAA